MTCDCIGDDLDGGIAGGGGGGVASDPPLLLIDVDRSSSTVFPIITSLIAEPIPANYLAADGDALEVELGGRIIGAGVTLAPFFGIGASFWFGTVTRPLPAGPLSWSLHAWITRKSAATFAASGRFMMMDFSTALVGSGEVQNLNNYGGAIASTLPDLAANWAGIESFLFNISAAGVGTTWTITSGGIYRRRA